MLTVSFARTGSALRFCAVCIVALGLLAAGPARADSTQAWDNASTALVLGLGGAALGTSLAKSDKQGLQQGLLAAGATLLAVEGLKAVVDAPRPDGSDNNSFPSGHTALAFAAATFFDIRYGDEYRQWVPVMYGLAALTGVARVEAKKHYARDVLAGAAIGFGMSYALTTPMPDGLMIAPTADGMMFSFTRHF